MSEQILHTQLWQPQSREQVFPFFADAANLETIHEHRFEEQEGGTLVIDHVRYRAPGGRWIERWLVKPDVERIFGFRQRRLLELFPGEKPASQQSAGR